MTECSSNTVSLDAEDYDLIIREIENCLRMELDLYDVAQGANQLVEAARQRIAREIKIDRHRDFAYGFIPLYERLRRASREKADGKYLVSFASL